jgi:serine/threonine-protein kinase RsbW
MPPGGRPEPTRADSLDDRVEVRVSLPALPANVALARQALAGLADELGIDATRVADMKIALTEACTNVVVHAYGEQRGPLEVTMAVEHGRLVLTVRDRGEGLHPLPASSEGPPLGFGLALITSLTDEFGIVGGRRGTAVKMAFALDDAPAPPLVLQLTDEPAPPSDAIVVRLAHGGHATSVLGRIVSLVAARTDFSIDRLSDAQIVSDAIAGTAGTHVQDGHVRVAIDEHDGGFDLVVGPLIAGGAQRLIRDTELPGLGCLLERLTDALEIEAVDAGGAELLRARLAVRD